MREACIQLFESKSRREDGTVAVLSVFALALFFSRGNLLVNACLIAYFAWLLLTRELSLVITAYIFMLFWESYTTLPFASSISVIGALLSFRCFLGLLRGGKVPAIDLIVILLLFCYGGLCFFFTRRLSGLEFATNSIIAAYVHERLAKDEAKRRAFWRRVFRFMLFSGSLAILVGCYNYFTGRVKTVYLGGISRGRRFAGTLGTDRVCMMCCATAIYPLFYMKKGKLRLAVIGLCLLAIIMTVGITAILCLALFALVYFVGMMKGRTIKKRTKRRLFLLLLAVLLLAVLAWQFSDRIGFVNSMVVRVKRVLAKLSDGDLVGATSHRSVLYEQYLGVFRGFSLPKKLLGSASLSYYYEMGFSNQSHNSYIDMLLYFGILPMLFLLFSVIRTIRSYKGSGIGLPILLLKVAYCFTGLSVSMLTASYWWMIVLL